jgi:hypothetical protein
MTELEELTRQLYAERERADYAWRNTRTVEAARQEEMRRRDAAETGLATLRKLAQAVLDARNKEARTAMSLENAQANFHRFDAEERAHEKAMIEASEADRALRDALATPNVEHDRRTAALSPGVRVDGPVGPLAEDDK